MDKVSTCDDLIQLADDLGKLQLRAFTDFYVAAADFPTRKLVSGWLQQKGIPNPQSVESAKALLGSLLSSSKQAVVYIDLEGLDVNGAEFARAIRSVDSKGRCKIVVLIPNMTPDLRDKVLNVGAHAVVPKPPNQESLDDSWSRMGYK